MRASEPPTNDDWYCGKCRGSAHEHSLESSTCIWEPVEVTRTEPPTDDEREALIDELNATASWLKQTGELLDADRVIRAIAALRNRGRQPITDEMVNKAWALLWIHHPDITRAEARAALEAAYKVMKTNEEKK